MRPLIKLTPSMLPPEHPQRMYSCRLTYGHGLYFVEGLGTSFRSAYNDWLDQMQMFA